MRFGILYIGIWNCPHRYNIRIARYSRVQQLNTMIRQMTQAITTVIYFEPPPLQPVMHSTEFNGVIYLTPPYFAQRIREAITATNHAFFCSCISKNLDYFASIFCCLHSLCNSLGNTSDPCKHHIVIVISTQGIHCLALLR